MKTFMALLITILRTYFPKLKEKSAYIIHAKSIQNVATTVGLHFYLGNFFIKYSQKLIIVISMIILLRMPLC